jgi:hypothetical protein
MDLFGGKTTMTKHNAIDDFNSWYEFYSDLSTHDLGVSFENVFPKVLEHIDGMSMCYRAQNDCVHLAAIAAALAEAVDRRTVKPRNRALVEKIVELRDEKELTFGQIGKKLKKKEGTVRAAYNRAEK